MVWQAAASEAMGGGVGVPPATDFAWGWGVLNAGLPTRARRPGGQARRLPYFSETGPFAIHFRRSARSFGGRERWPVMATEVVLDRMANRGWQMANGKWQRQRLLFPGQNSTW